MNRDHLHYFLALAKHENIHHAAEELGVTPATLFLAVKTIEERLGGKFYNTKDMRISLSKQGRYFIPKAKEMLKIDEKILEKVSTNLKFVHYFLALAELENVNHAAEQINVNPASLHYGVKMLEKDLGYKLYHRVRRHIELNDKGRSFIREAKKILKLEEKMLKIEASVRKKFKSAA